ncbi:MAG: hypothetical protein AAGI25_13575 [Bacteroidota bacterium]
METVEVSPFNAFDRYSAASLETTVDGTNYFWAEEVGDDASTSYLLRQNSADDYTVVSKHLSGEWAYINKLW